MALVAICDLCGKPLAMDKARIFKVKELKVSWYEQHWEVIGIHNDCLLKLLGKVHENAERSEEL